MPPSRILPATPDAIRRAAELLRAGALVAFPTETVYGLGAHAWDESAVRQIFVVKGRPAGNPLIVHLPASQDLSPAVAVPLSPLLAARVDCLRDLWPGPLTLILPRNPRIAPSVTAGRRTVAVRVPAHPVALELLAACGFPLAAPSANPSTYISPTTAQHVADELGSGVALVLDGGPSAWGLESTIVSLVETPPRILRFGAIAAEELAGRLAVPLEVLLRHAPADEEPPSTSRPAPGMLPQHYAPRTPLVFRDPARTAPFPLRTGLIAFRPVDAAEPPFAVIRVLSEHGQLDEVARQLFATLRELDHAGLDLIVVDACPEEGLGRAIMDRLRRAVHDERPACSL